MVETVEKVRMKRDLDEALYRSSIDTIAEMLGKRADNFAGNSAWDPVVRQMNLIMQSIKAGPVDVPDSIIEDEAKILYMMSSTGTMRRRVELTGKWWQEGALPMLCTKQDGTLTALLPGTSGGYAFIAEDTGKQISVTKKNAASFSSVAFCFYKSFPGESITARKFLAGIFRSFSTADVTYLLVISLVVALLGLVLPLMNQIIFNTLIPSGTVKDIWGILSLLIGVTIVSALFTLARSVWVLRIGNKIQIFAENAVWSRLFGLPVSFFKQYEAGELTKRAAAVSQICQTVSSQLIPTLLGSVFAFLYLFQISKLSGKLLLPSLLIILLMVASAVSTSWMQTRYAQGNNQILNRLSSLVFQLFSGVQKLKVAGAEVRAFSKWSRLYAKYVPIPNLFLNISQAVNNLISFGGTILLYVIAYKGNLSSSDYIAFNVAFGSFMAAVLQLSSLTYQLAALKPAISLLAPILKAETESNAGKKRVSKLKGNIEINQVNFRYNQEMPLVLNDLSLVIEPGDYVGIIGASGCGKSTLMRLLLGFESPESGAVYYDMQDLSGLDLRSVRQRIGVVLQNGKLFSGDIYSNIVICAPWLSVEEAWSAAERAGFAEDIKAMPMGMHTMISEGGGGISGGQQQRLLIARALAASPDIVMFDEATSALDNITQAMVVKTLLEMDVTRIVIAHRLSTIRCCNKIVYLDKGRIAEMGTYDELMALNGLFAQMAKRQTV